MASNNVDIPILAVGTKLSNAKSIVDAVTSLSVSHTMDMASSVQFTVHDKNFEMLRANYFQIRREVYFRGEIFEIASIDVSSGQSGDPEVAVECFPRSIQKMKRDKKPTNYGSTSSYDYVKKIAEKFNLYFIGQPTSKTQSIPQAKNEKTDESVWDVVKRLADEAEFVCFVASIPYETKTKKEGVLFFISQKKLLKLWGPSSKTIRVKVNGKLTNKKIQFIPLEFPPPPNENNFVILEIPQFRKSDNDWREAEGSAILWNDPLGNAQMIRPGMSVRISNYAPDFNGYYLITAVEWSEDEPGPVKIAFRTPEIPKKKTSSSDSGNSGDGGSGGSDVEETLVPGTRRENIEVLRTVYGSEYLRAIVGKSDDYIAGLVSKIKESTYAATQPSGVEVP